MNLFVVKTERINYLCAVNVVRRLLKTNSFGFGRQNKNKRRIIADLWQEKSLSYVLVERKLNVGPKGKQIM